MSKKGLLVVVSAPSGSGKTTLCRNVVSSRPNTTYPISTTTRPARKGEKNGRDYLFLSRDEFEEKKQNGEFLEWANVFGEYYGTLRQLVENTRNKGKDVVLNIDIQGASQVKKRCPEAVLVFILPPSIGILEQRLRDRKSDTEDEILKRLQLARIEISKIDNYDYVVVNKDIKDSVDKLLAIITAEKARLERMRDEIDDSCRA